MLKATGCSPKTSEKKGTSVNMTVVMMVQK
jgi:hypothetical protein